MLMTLLMNAFIPLWRDKMYNVHWLYIIRKIKLGKWKSIPAEIIEVRVTSVHIYLIDDDKTKISKIDKVLKIS